MDAIKQFSFQNSALAMLKVFFHGNKAMILPLNTALGLCVYLWKILYYSSKGYQDLVDFKTKKNITEANIPLGLLHTGYGLEFIL